MSNDERIASAIEERDEALKALADLADGFGLSLTESETPASTVKAIFARCVACTGSQSRPMVVAFLGRRMTLKGSVDHESLAFSRQELIDRGYHELEIVSLLWGGSTPSSTRDFEKLVAAVKYVDAFFPESEDTKLWEKENAEAIAIARGQTVASAIERPMPTLTEHVMPRDEWNQCALILAAVGEFLHSKDEPAEYTAITKMQQGMNDLERIVGSPLFRPTDRTAEGGKK